MFDASVPFVYKSPPPPLCGIYALICTGEVVYIGSSVDLIQRLTDHWEERFVLFPSESKYRLQVS